jgi:CheY-like chemotaxis protein
VLASATSRPKVLRSGEGALLRNKKVAVLVVEDLPQVRATAVRIMEDLGCAVFDAYSGHQALKLLQAHPEIAVLFADVRMPGMSGTELAEAAQGLRPDLRIVLTSGYVGPKDVPAHIPFVPKPWRVDAIADAVTNVH